MSASQRAAERESKDFLNRYEKKAGVYVVAPVTNISSTGGQKLHVKIGMSKNLKKRLDKYLLYWPQGVRVFILAHINTPSNARIVETTLLRYLIFKNKHLVLGHSHDEEWVNLSLEELRYLVHLLRCNFVSENNIDFLPGIQKIEDLVQSPLVIVSNPQIGQNKIKAFSREDVLALERALKECGPEPTEDHLKAVPGEITPKKKPKLKRVITSIKKPSKRTKDYPSRNSFKPIKLLTDLSYNYFD